MANTDPIVMNFTVGKSFKLPNVTLNGTNISSAYNLIDLKKPSWL